MSPSSPSASREKLGQELRRLREGAGLLIERAAEVLECSQSKVSRLETGKGIPRTRDVRDLLDLYEVQEEDERARLLELAQEGQSDEWWSDYRDVVRGELFADHLIRYVEAEQEATNLRSFQPELFPGLLQGRPYAEAIASHLYPSSEEQARLRFVEFRLRRAEILRSRGRTFGMVVSEAALLRPIGGPEVMRAQLSMLHKTLENELGHLDLRVLPFDISPAAAMGGPFVVLRFPPGRRDCVYLESRESADYLTGEDKLDEYDQKFEQLTAAALSREASLKRLATAAQDWEQRA